MTWARLDDRMTFHPKVVDAGNAAVGVWARMIAHCAAHLTDGYVSAKVARAIGSETELKDATAAGLIELAADGGGFVVHDFLQWNPSAEKVRLERDTNAIKVAEWRSRNAARNDLGTGSCNPVTDSVTNSVTNLNHSDPIRSDPIRKKKTYACAFDLDAVYSLYPRKLGKAKGYAALAREICTEDDYRRLQTAVKCFAAQMERECRPEDKIPYFSTWANGQWRDWADRAERQTQKRPTKAIVQPTGQPIPSEEPNAVPK